MVTTNGYIRLKTIFFTFLSLCLFTNLSFSTNMINGGDPIGDANKVKKIVLDAGHGGIDPGAIGKRSKEKDIALSLTLKLGNSISQNFPEIEVIYTRKTDVKIDLHERARIANNANADLFISLHCNAVNSSSPYGSETYVMGLARNQSNLEVAKRENGVILLEENYKENYNGFDPNSEASHIILNMYQNAYLDNSLALANSFETNLRTRNQRKSRGVKQAGFLVLRNTFMPSVLFEAGFISNPTEEKYLLSEKGQNEIVESLILAIKDYKKKLEKNPELQKTSASMVEKKVEEKAPEIAKTSHATDSKPAIQEKQMPTSQISTSQVKSGLEFCVQLAATPKKENIKSGQWKNIKNLSIRFENNMYKYQVTAIESYNEASDIKKQMRARGFNGAFIVAYSNGDRVNISEAVSMSH
ncbi:N-acetylmuramoyl-L-alanine amidase [Membranihabitans maritimus]|uniref:N-acetylmuramoyl-L-alanine amidase n=1 Tax=Membranihabitans maritimus TaxID=2904244 RepID=UPI001F18DDA1|nr:N-acetylmuramoyl-L-alanine amidase [Membranihabitans maritimus]